MAIRSTPRETSGEKQGIAVAILASDSGGGGGGERRGASLRRTLSADMSSKKWMEQNGLVTASPMKRIASSKDFNSGEDGDEEEERVEIKKEFDIWSSIISQKNSNTPVYIHPLVKRAKSSLSENSLQLCTESLGSETGSDGFSASSEASDSESECSQKEEAGQTCREKSPEEEYTAVKSPARKSPASFPPPLPSLSSRCGGDGSPTIRMQSHRVNGRLVVEAVSVPASRKNFAAQRQDGRLVLMFSSETEEEEAEVEEEVEVEEAVYEVTRRVDFATEPRVISFHKLALMADKRRNNPDDVAEKKMGLVAASLPPRPRGPGGRLNHYEYFWRTKLSGGSNDSKTVENDKRQRVVLEGHRGDGFLASSLKGCYEKQRRPLTWEPRCIATS